MAHYALLNQDLIVQRVFVGRDETETVDGVSDWETYYAPEGMIVKRTSYNMVGGEHLLGKTPFRFNYAQPGYTYDEERDAFIPPKPFDSWILNEATCLWEAPIQYPNDGAVYTWDEDLGDWVEVTVE